MYSFILQNALSVLCGTSDIKNKPQNPQRLKRLVSQVLVGVDGGVVYICIACLYLWLFLYFRFQPPNPLRLACLPNVSGFPDNLSPYVPGLKCGPGTKNAWPGTMPPGTLALFASSGNWIGTHSQQLDWQRCQPRKWDGDEKILCMLNKM